MMAAPIDSLGPDTFPLAFRIGVQSSRWPTMPQFVTRSDEDRAERSGFTEARAVASARKYRPSVIASWLCPRCRVWTRPSRGPSPDVCDAVDCRTPRPALEGPPRADARPESWRLKVRPQTVHIPRT